MPMARPDRKPPHTSAEGPLNPVSTDTTSDCAATAVANPVISLNGRRLVNQNSGDIITATVAPNGIHRLVSPGLTLTSALNSANKQHASTAPEMALQMARPLTSGCETCTSRSSDVDPLARPMKTGYPGGCGWCFATSKSATPKAKLIESRSSSDGGRNSR